MPRRAAASKTTNKRSHSKRSHDHQVVDGKRSTTPPPGGGGHEKKRRPKASRKSPPLRHVPQPPDELGPEGKQYWHSLAPQLIDLGILTPLHLESFRVLCEQWQMYRTLTDWLDEDPSRLYFTTDNGYQQETPQVRLREKALSALKSLWMKFGLTPHGLAALGKHGGVAKKQMPAIAEFAKKKYED